MAHKMAIESPRVSADAVEASEFPQLAQKYEVMGVPKIVVNEDVQFVGALPEAQYLKEVMRAAG